MIVVVNKFILARGYIALAVYPFIFLKSKNLKEDEVLLNHEKIHLRQQLELLVIFFFIWYGIEYCYNILKYGNLNMAYRQISFEKEAYENERDLNYLKNRSWYGFFKMKN